MRALFGTTKATLIKRNKLMMRKEKTNEQYRRRTSDTVWFIQLPTNPNYKKFIGQ